MSNITIPVSEPIKLFNGYVSNISANVGWGSQSSNAQVTIVYKSDGPLNPDDLTKNFPAMGTCVGIAVGKFSFAGIFKRYTHERSIDGYKFNIILESPSQALDGVQVILDTFQGSNYYGDGTFTNQINNVWNPFGIRENANFAGGIFGGAGVNSAGFPAIDCFNLLESISREETNFGGKIYYGETKFQLDLSELKQAISNLPTPTGYRVKTPIQTLSSIIDDACSLIMHDYVAVIKPLAGEITTGVLENVYIKIKLVDRSNPPDLNVVKQIVNQYEKSGKLINASVGKELTDASTQKLVIGGAATRYYVATQPALTQIWGRTRGATPTYVSCIILDDGSRYPTPSVDVAPDHMEVRCAMHSFDSWIVYHLIRKKAGIYHPYIDTLSEDLFTNVRVDDFVLARIAAGKLNTMDIIDSTLQSAQKRNMITVGGYVYETLQRIHSAIKNAGEEYWGRKYFVALPAESGGIANNLKFINGDYHYVNSWEIADSAWYEPFPSPYVSDISFYDGDGKLKPTASWEYDPVNNDYTSLGNGYAFAPNGISSVISVERDIIWKTNYPMCVAEIQGVSKFDSYTTEHNGLAILLNYFLGISFDKLSNLYKVATESGSTVCGIAPTKIIPTAIGIPQVSTRYRWGPWYDYKSLKGRAEVVLEDSLTPETFGGRAGMTSVGRTYAKVINAEVTGRESGSVETYGIPEYNIVERFATSGPYITNMDINISVTGCTTSYRFNTWTPEFGRLAKYNIDRLATINKNFIRFFSEFRGKADFRPFEKPRYRDRVWWNNRPFSLGMNGFNFFAAMLNPIKDNKGKVQNVDIMMHGGAAQNQVAPLALDWDNGFGCSTEQIFTPIATTKTKPNKQNGVPQTEKSLDTKNNAPNSDKVDPYFTHDHDHDFNIAAHGKTKPKDLNLKNQNTKPEMIKSVGLRGPLLLSGWGYGLDMKPSPYKEDDITAFPDNIKSRRDLWKSGSVDLRWDEVRKVWGCGFDFVEGILVTDVTKAESFDRPTKFTVEVKRCKDKLDYLTEMPTTLTISTNTKEDQIIGVNRDKKLSGSIGDYVILIRINYEWRPIYIGNC